MILTTVEDGVGTLTFNRPKSLNAFNNELIPRPRLLAFTINTGSPKNDVNPFFVFGEIVYAFVVGCRAAADRDCRR